MKRLIGFLGLVFACLLYGLVFDSIVDSMSTGLYCTFLAQNPCLLSQQMDRWLSIITVLVVAPVGIVAFINWFTSSQKRLTTLFGWIIVVP